jgi:hypothetical protein
MTKLIVAFRDFTNAPKVVIYTVGTLITLYRILLVFFFGATTPSEPGPHSRSVYITHNDAQESVGLLWKSDQLVAETST